MMAQESTIVETLIRTVLQEMFPPQQSAKRKRKALSDDDDEERADVIFKRSIFYNTSIERNTGREARRCAFEISIDAQMLKKWNRTLSELDGDTYSKRKVIVFYGMDGVAWDMLPCNQKGEDMIRERRVAARENMRQAKMMKEMEQVVREQKRSGQYPVLVKVGRRLGSHPESGLGHLGGALKPTIVEEKHHSRKESKGGVSDLLATRQHNRTVLDGRQERKKNHRTEIQLFRENARKDAQRAISFRSRPFLRENDERGTSCSRTGCGGERKIRCSNIFCVTGERWCCIDCAASDGMHQYFCGPVEDCQ